jgi:TonB family protein
MRAADPVQNLGTAEVVHLDRTVGSHRPSPVYAQRRDGALEDLSGTFELEIDVRSASTQLYQWLIIFAVLGLVIGGAKWWSAREGAAIAALAAAPSALSTTQQQAGGAPRSPSDDGTVSAVDPGAAGPLAGMPAGRSAGDPASARAPGQEASTDVLTSADGTAAPGEAAPPDAPAQLVAAPAITGDVRTVRAPADVPYPRRIEGIDPDLPEGAGVQRGIAVLALLIDARGNVVEAELLRNVDPALDDAALTAARQWKFEPTVHDGRPVAVRSNFTVRFGY